MGMILYSWARYHADGYEVSSKGDRRYSAFNAIMADGRSIEMWYQCDVKGYQPGGQDWRLGKGKPSLIEYPAGVQLDMYITLWKTWIIAEPLRFGVLRATLVEQKKTVLTDCFATTPINQAHALARILNDWSV